MLEAELQIDDRGAAAAVTAAQESGASDTEVATLQATANQLKGERDTLFKGETLRGLLRSTLCENAPMDRRERHQ